MVPSISTAVPELLMVTEPLACEPTRAEKVCEPGLTANAGAGRTPVPVKGPRVVEPPRASSVTVRLVLLGPAECGPNVKVMVQLLPADTAAEQPLTLKFVESVRLSPLTCSKPWPSLLTVALLTVIERLAVAVVSNEPKA